jgi:hypothetical protein
LTQKCGDKLFIDFRRAFGDDEINGSSLSPQFPKINRPAAIFDFFSRRRGCTIWSARA